MKITKNKLKQIIKEELRGSMMQEAEGETAQEVAERLMAIPQAFRHGALQDFENMVAGSTEMAQYYPHVQDLAAFAQEVLSLAGPK
jgi:CheY-specific phosphatase CheX